MRIKQDRLKEYFLKKRKVIKDSEGGTSEEYGAAVSFKGVCWPASGKIQAAQYGQRLAYIRNVKIEGKYEVRAEENGRIQSIISCKMEWIWKSWTECAFIQERNRTRIIR